MTSCMVSSTSLIFLRVSPTLRAIPNMILVDVPMNTSPCAPTYSASSDVLIALVAVIERLHVDASSPSTETLAPTVRSTLLSIFSSRATPIPVTVTAAAPSLDLVSTLFSLFHTPPSECETEVTVPDVHSVLDFVPGGSRSTMSSMSGPAVTKLLPVGRAPRTIPLIGAPLFQRYVLLSIS